MRNRAIAVGASIVAIAASLGAMTSPLRAEEDPAAKNERCAIRLSMALLGKSPDAALLRSAAPQDSVDAMLADPAFVERFARYTNRRFNAEPGDNVGEDAVYTLAKHVLTNRLPWKEMFVGRTNVGETVTADPAGLGYFRSDGWMRRYAGNEPAGYRLVAAYRILQNTTGLDLAATTNAPEADISAEGRKAPQCKVCHYEGWFALDKVAKVLSRRQGLNKEMKFIPPNEGPQTILDDESIANDEALVKSLVSSEDYRVHQCRVAFGFLYGRPENTCEAPVFEKCLDAFTSEGTMQAAVRAIAKDAGFCQ
jgi:hypothetical protein